MRYVVGIDIGNSTTEGALASIGDDEKAIFLASAIVNTTGIKGTSQNKYGIHGVISQLLKKANLTARDIDLIRINEAAPVMCDVAMETITETIITESTMIGHNPKTPSGIGLCSGKTVDFKDILSPNFEDNGDAIVIVSKEYDFEDVANAFNEANRKGIKIKGAILQKNRLNFRIPIIDEVEMIEKIPLGVECGVEVAEQGKVIEELSNPYGIASIFNLTPEETKKVVPISRALMGNRSAVVIKTPEGDVKERTIPAGKIIISGDGKEIFVNIEDGAEKIMQTISKIKKIEDIRGEAGKGSTNNGKSYEKENFRYLYSRFVGS